MANEIHADYASGNSVYAVIRNGAGAVWCPAEQAFEDWGADAHTAADYALPLVDKDGGRHVGDFDADVPPGSYHIQLFLQAGTSPADGDPFLSGRDITWTGQGELTALTILANKAVQNTTTKTINYYADDDRTIVLTHDWQEDASSSTRTIH